MTCITVTTQAELDAALASTTARCLHIDSPKGVWLNITANPKHDVEASGSASVSASGSASVRASGSASVRAYDSASVRAYDSASVRAYDSASVRASGSASVRAYDSASVSAGTHVAVHLHSKQVHVQGGVVIDVTDLDLTDPTVWAGHHGADITDGRITLYKATDSALTAGQDYDRPTVYEPGTELVAADWVDTNECGGGFHLGPTPHHATAYRQNATRWLRCTAAVEDVRPITEGGTAKVKVRALRVEAEVDFHGRPVKTKTPAAVA